MAVNARKNETEKITFTEVTSESGLGKFYHDNGSFGEMWFPEQMGSGGGFVDYNNDSWVDILLVGGGGWANHTKRNIKTLWLYKNNKDGTFSEVTEETGLGFINTYGLGIVTADYDNDGKIDMFITVNGQQIEDGKGNTIFDANQGKGILLQNRSKTKNNWIKVRLEGVQSNRDGFGTVVNIQSNNIDQKQSLVSGQGYFSNHAKELYFGLGNSDIVDIVEIKWPSGLKQILKFLNLLESSQLMV